MLAVLVPLASSCPNAIRAAPSPVAAAEACWWHVPSLTLPVEEGAESGWQGRMHAMKVVLDKMAGEQKAESRARREDAKAFKEELAALHADVKALRSHAATKPCDCLSA